MSASPTLCMPGGPECLRSALRAELADVAGALLASESRASRAAQYISYGQAASPLDRAASGVS
jgi:hypothetical protein